MPFAVSWSSAAAYAVGLAVLFLLGRLLLKPLTWVLKLVCNALIGALLLFAVNFHLTAKFLKPRKCFCLCVDLLKRE